MDMSRVPFTLKCEIRRLEKRLKELEEQISTLSSKPIGTIDFERYKYEREKSRIQLDIQNIQSMLDPGSGPDFA